MQSERDEASEEAMLLSAQVAEQARQISQYQDLQKSLAEFEKRDLESQAAIQTRDKMIAELSSKLDKTLDQLEEERSARRVIFPKRGDY